MQVKKKSGYVEVRIRLPEDRYNLLLQRKMINGVPMSQSIEELFVIKTDGSKK